MEILHDISRWISDLAVTCEHQKVFGLQQVVGGDGLEPVWERVFFGQSPDKRLQPWEKRTVNPKTC